MYISASVCKPVSCELGFRVAVLSVKMNRAGHACQLSFGVLSQVSLSLSRSLAPGDP